MITEQFWRQKTRQSMFKKKKETNTKQESHQAHVNPQEGDLSSPNVQIDINQWVYELLWQSFPSLSPKLFILHSFS